MARIEDLSIEEAPEAGAPRSRPARRLVIGLASSALVGLSAVAWWVATRDGGAPPAQTPPVAVAQVAAPVAAGAITAGGYVEIVPPGPTVVAARVAGPVAAVAVVEGVEVEAGQLLATVDDTEPRQVLAEATADLALVRAHLARLEAGYRQEEVAEAGARRDEAAARAAFARGDFTLQQELAAIGAAPERQLLAAGRDLAAAEALFALRRAGTRPEDLAVAAAAVAQAEARRDRFAWQVEQCVVRAPVGGVVLELFVRVGDRVAPGRDGDRQGAVLTLFDPARLQVWVEVNQRDAGRVQVGQRVELRADAWRDRSVAGRVERVMPRANLQRNTVEVKVAVERVPGATGQEPRLRPDMSVQVTFLEAPSETRDPRAGDDGR